WGPWAIGDHGAPVSLPKLKKAYEKGTRGISWGPLLTPDLLGQCPSFQMVSPPLAKMYSVTCLLKRNPNTCKLIGLRESYSVYKWRYIYCQFVLFFFYTCN
ncbi:unnamed protein product, partial [Staurois parvus]